MKAHGLLKRILYDHRNQDIIATLILVFVHALQHVEIIKYPKLNPSLITYYSWSKAWALFNNVTTIVYPNFTRLVMDSVLDDYLVMLQGMDKDKVERSDDVLISVIVQDSFTETTPCLRKSTQSKMLLYDRFFHLFSWNLHSCSSSQHSNYQISLFTQIMNTLQLAIPTAGPAIAFSESRRLSLLEASCSLLVFRRDDEHASRKIVCLYVVGINKRHHRVSRRHLIDHYICSTKM